MFNMKISSTIGYVKVLRGGIDYWSYECENQYNVGCSIVETAVTMKASMAIQSKSHYLPLSLI